MDGINDAIWDSAKNEFIEKVKSFNYQSDDETKLSTKEEVGVINDVQSSVIDYMKQVGRDVKISEISSYIGLSIASTSRIMRQLIHRGIVIPLGSSKYCNYRLA